MSFFSKCCIFSCFFCDFFESCLISLRLKFLKSDEGLLRDKITFYDYL